MQLANILEPEENLTYVITKFKENLVETCEDLRSNEKAMKDLESNISKLIGSGKKKVDPHGFIAYITGKDLAAYMTALKPKPTKRKPLSFDRLAILVIPIFKYFEGVYKTEGPKVLKTLEVWLSFIQSQSEQNLNTLFESQLNLYLVLSEETAMKSVVFQHLIKFLVANGQLQSVMIA